MVSEDFKLTVETLLKDTFKEIEKLEEELNRESEIFINSLEDKERKQNEKR